MKIDRKRLKLILLVFFANALGVSVAMGAVGAGGTFPQYHWLQEPFIESFVKAEMSLGSLDQSNLLTGKRGTPVIHEFSIHQAVSSDLLFRFNLPLAGTLSGGNDDYGIGNVGVGLSYAYPLDRWTVLLSLDLDLPTATFGARLGTFTQEFTNFTKDQVAVSPRMGLSYQNGRWAMGIDLGGDLQVFTDVPPGFDRFEQILSFGAGTAWSFEPNLWATLEVTGYRTMSYANDTTQLYAGPGIRFQDHDLSLGFHVTVPVRQPARQVIDLLTAFEFRFLY